MNTSLAIPRKDAHLASIILWPWVAVLGIVLVACTFGHLIPGMSDVLWGYSRRVPPVSERMYLVAALASLACYLVPCWVAVVVSVGDRTRQAGLLAAVVPVQDSKKIASKLCIIAAISLAVWLVWLACALAADGTVDISLKLLAASAVFIGACSGLGATVLVRRTVPAIVLATLMPLAGLPIAWSIAAIVRDVTHTVSVPGSFVPEIYAKLVWSPVFDWGWLVSAACVVLPLAIRSVPILSGRDARVHVVRMCGVAVVAACLPIVIWSLAVGIWNPDLVRWRMQSAHFREVEAQIRESSDEALVKQAFAFPRKSELAFIARLPPNSSPPPELMISHLRDSRLPGNGDMRLPLMRELQARLRDPKSTIRWTVDAYLNYPETGPLSRLKFADLISEPEGEAIAAAVLIDATSEQAHMAALAFLASGQPWDPDDARRNPDGSRDSDWCDCIRLAREDLEESLYGRLADPISHRPAIPPLQLTPEQRVVVERALNHVNRPHPIIAQLLAQDPEWASSPVLECIRTGQAPSTAAPAAAPKLPRRPE